MTTTTRPIEVVSFNVRGFPAMRQWRVRHDLLLALGLHAGLYGWQECWKPRYRRAIRKLFNGYNHNAPPDTAGTAVSYLRSSFGFLAAGQEPLHARLLGVCGVRRITWVRLLDRETGLIFTFVSTHLVPGAWNPSQKYRAAGRRQRWLAGMERLAAFLEAETEAGHPVIVCVDANAPHAAVVNALGDGKLAGARVQVQSAAPDHIVLVGPWRALAGPDQVRGAFSDHPPLTLTVRLVDEP